MRVLYPYPRRMFYVKVKMPASVRKENKGKLLCLHRYLYDTYHEQISQGTRYSIRHYRCEKCGKVVWVDGWRDAARIERALLKTSPDNL